MQTIEGFPFFSLTFDQDGVLESRDEFGAMVERAKTAPRATDAVFLAHGFRNDVNDASRLYSTFLRNFRAHLSRTEFKDIAGRQFLAAGVYWPAKPFRETYGSDSSGTRGLENPSNAMADAKAELEELKKDDATPAQRRKLDKAIKLLPKLEGNPKAQDDFVKLVWSLLDDSTLDATEGLPQVRARSGSEVLANLSGPAAGTRGIGDVVGGDRGRHRPVPEPDEMVRDEEPIGRRRAALGSRDAVREFRKSCPDVRVHLVGHSLGGRLMAGCVKALGEAPRLQVDSLTLLEAAFSHFGFSADNGQGVPGFFRDVIVNQIVKGPFVSTFSSEDTVVGYAYAVMSRLARDNTRGIGDASMNLVVSVATGRSRPKKLRTRCSGNRQRRTEYKPGVINNLDGSGGFIKNHGDVTNEAVTYAFASAVAQTR